MSSIACIVAATFSPELDQPDEGIFCYKENDNPVTRRLPTETEDRKLFQLRQFGWFDLRGAHM